MHQDGSRAKEVPVKYAMFIVIDPEASEADDAAAPSIEGWFDYMIGKGAFLQGIRLQPKDDATTVRVRDGKVLITDGPFTESREWIAGLGIIEAEDLDEAIEQALKHNMAYQGRLELRPIHSIVGPEDRGAALEQATANVADQGRLEPRHLMGGPEDH
jgi:hypothetical protein